MARLIVHIGAPAAGAAPLQIRLARRAEALERAGACWLDASDLAGGRPNLDAMVKLSGRGEAFRARIGLRRALALCKPRAEICLGSSERLWWLDDPALIAGFAEGLRKVYERIDIVACLPRQDRMLVAQRAPAAAPRALTLAARLWGTEPRALPSWRPEFAGRLDHAARLDRWRAAFGADSVHALIDPRDAAEPEAAPTLAATLAGLAGLPAELRQHHQQRFLREDGIIMVATIAFGMGIDKPDVRFVAHLDLPKSVEAYYQETGRAGRDGEPATALLLYGLEDVVKLGQMAASSEGNEQFKRLERQRLDAMLGLCEITSCRRQTLLRYFGETLEQPCGNCDCCLQPPVTWDGSEAARKLLSCVYRTGQRFGANHVVDVLRGSTNEKVMQFKHDQLSTYGIGRDLSVNEWRAVVRQLVARAYLQVDPDAYGALRWLQAQPFVIPSKVALGGWSNGAMSMLTKVHSKS